MLQIFSKTTSYGFEGTFEEWCENFNTFKDRNTIRIALKICWNLETMHKLILNTSLLECIFYLEMRRLKKMTLKLRPRSIEGLRSLKCDCT